MTSFTIEGMTCNGCLTKIRTALQRLSPSVSVTLDPPRAIFADAETPALAEIGAALSATGPYRAKPAQDAVSPPAAGPLARKGWIATYYPLLLIIGYIVIVALAAGIAGGQGLSAYGWMNAFMAGFFLVFSFFKLLDIRGFAESYATYDLLAARWNVYGFIYPFIELGLGLAYLFGWQPVLTGWATLIIMGFSSLGVIAALMERRQIRCACLGTVLNLPMSTVTLVEDLAMVVMAGLMIAHLHG